VLQYVAASCCVLQCVAVRYTYVLQYVAVHCSVHRSEDYNDIGISHMYYIYIYIYIYMYTNIHIDITICIEHIVVYMFSAV